jgi:hypothetical protein
MKQGPNGALLHSIMCQEIELLKPSLIKVFANGIYVSMALRTPEIVTGYKLICIKNKCPALGK